MNSSHVSDCTFDTMHKRKLLGIPCHFKMSFYFINPSSMQIKLKIMLQISLAYLVYS